MRIVKRLAAVRSAEEVLPNVKAGVAANPMPENAQQDEVERRALPPGCD